MSVTTSSKTAVEAPVQPGLEPLLKVGVVLSPEFLRALMDEAREKIVIGGYRAGKSTEAAAEIWIDPPLWDPEYEARYWIVGPTYQAAHKEFDYLLRWSRQLGLGAHVSAPQDGIRTLQLKTNTIIETRSAQHPERLASDRCDGVIMVEAGQQPPDVLDVCRGRVLETGGWIVACGTLEDDEGHPRWAWYGDTAEAWALDRNREHSAYSLPSWSNPVVFPGGRSDLKIQSIEAVYDSFTFSRRIAAIPAGVQHPVYPQVIYGSNRLAIPRQDVKWSVSVGGQDYGTTEGHESALVVISESVTGAVWARACWFQGGGDAIAMNGEMQRLRVRYGAHRWGFDPNERYAASMMGGEAVRMGEGSRAMRQGRVRGLLNEGRLWFDMTAEGIPELYAEMKRVRSQRLQTGELKYVRRDDNRVAALENAVEELLAPGMPLPEKVGGSAVDWTKVRLR